jgi:sodium pump decarboxylase gamma subunit
MMKIAAINTLMGMGTVFLVLILISIIIYLMGFIGKAQTGKKDSKTVPEAKTPEPVEVAETVSEDLSEDLELVAVIAAAIAASENVPVDSLVVRSIRRKTSPSRWKNV